MYIHTVEPLYKGHWDHENCPLYRGVRVKSLPWLGTWLGTCSRWWYGKVSSVSRWRYGKKFLNQVKKDLWQFKHKTPMTLFCQTRKKRWFRIDSSFREMVAMFDWPAMVTLRVFEQFQNEYAYEYSLQECAMMLVAVMAMWCWYNYFLSPCIVSVYVHALWYYNLSQQPYKLCWPTMVC